MKKCEVEKMEEEIRLYTTSELAELLHISTRQVHNFRKAGLIQGTRFGKKWVYTYDEVLRFITVSKGKTIVV